MSTTSNNNNKKNTATTPMNAYEILFSYNVPQPGSITIPGSSPEDAGERLKKFLESIGGYTDLKIDSITDVKDAPTFKTMVAYHTFSLEQEQMYFNKWLEQNSAATANDAAIEDAEVIEVPAKALN